MFITLPKVNVNKNLILYGCVSSCNIYVNQPDTQCFMIEFIHNIWWLNMVRTSAVHLQERLQAVCCKCDIQLVNELNHKTLCNLLDYIYIVNKNIYEVFINCKSTNSISFIFSVPGGTYECFIRGSGTRESGGLRAPIYHVTSKCGFV